jgi:hypothetical protein
MAETLSEAERVLRSWAVVGVTVHSDSTSITAGVPLNLTTLPGMSDGITGVMYSRIVASQSSGFSK